MNGAVMNGVTPDDLPGIILQVQPLDHVYCRQVRVFGDEFRELRAAAQGQVLNPFLKRRVQCSGAVYNISLQQAVF